MAFDELVEGDADRGLVEFVGSVRRLQDRDRIEFAPGVVPDDADLLDV
jgi:hypothetical protein